MLNKIGYINSIDFSGLLEELKPLDKNARLKKYWTNGLYLIQNEKIADKSIVYYDSILVPDNYYDTAEECFELSNTIAEKVKKGLLHYKSINQKSEVVFLNEEFVVFNYSASNYVVIPRRYAEIDFVKDFSSLPKSQIINMIKSETSGNYLQLKDDKSRKELNNDLLNAKNELEMAEKKAKEELEKFQEEIRKKEMELREKQEAMLSELRQKVEDMKDSIFVLEMNIFALRSFLGDTFSISHVVKGKNAEDNRPLIIYQKFRYMDEDLSRLTVNSEFSTAKKGIIDLFTTYKDIFINEFCPEEKCITFFKASRDNKFFEYSSKEDIIDELEYYHGNQIGMIIRNGENIYLSFIDEEITLQDNLFVTKGVENQEVSINIDNVKIRDKELKPVFSRKLIFIILQTLLKNTNIFSSLKNEILLESDKIVFSSADNNIVYNKYPTFKEVFKEEKNIKIWDEIFILDRHAGSKYERNYWGYGSDYESHRSRGYENRARDAEIPDGVQRINFIEDEIEGYYKIVKENSIEYFIRVNKDDFDKLPEDLRKESHTIKYFVSCKRDIEDWMRPRDWFGNIKTTRVNNVNLRIYNDEFMSIMWINSNYVQQWIDTKDVIDKNYVYYINKLKELRDYLKDKEIKEFDLINKITKFEINPDNLDTLLKFKKEKQIRNFTEFQAKRFIKWLKNS